ncbi:MAG TPA: class I SAM-dependent methyltransferase [Armatimonadota bacterium]|nr:class I SAM-dependent methyltransferase [Armatimonadota bacterium]
MPIAAFVADLDVPGWLCDAEAEFLIRAIVEHPTGGLCVDMGSFAGRSSACLAFACKLRGDGSRVVSIEPFDSIHTRQARVTEETYWANLRRLGLESYVTQHVERSPGAARHVADASACLIFIDGDHAYQSVAADLAAWLPKLQRGGVLAMHDFRRGWILGQVWEAAHDVLPQVNWQEMQTATGFGWWTKPGQGE